MNENFKSKLNSNIYYILAFAMSFTVLFFFPFFGSELNLKMKLPNTVAGWILYVIDKSLVSGLNLGIFYAFNEQGRINVRDNERYKKAIEILAIEKPKEYRPRSVAEWKRKTYSTKGIGIVFGTLATLVGIGNAVLKYDYVLLLTYILTILIAIVCGAMQMLKAEDYYCNEFYDYAKELERKRKDKEELECLLKMENNSGI